MEGYLGDFEIAGRAPYASYTASDWAIEWVARYGQIDGDHHKAWVLDQVARILMGTPVIVREARWENGEREIRFHLGEPSPAYLAWVEGMKSDDDGEEYDYEVGVAP